MGITTREIVVHPLESEEQERFVFHAGEPACDQRNGDQGETQLSCGLAGDASAWDGAGWLVYAVFLDGGGGALIRNIEDEKVDPDEGESCRDAGQDRE